MPTSAKIILDSISPDGVRLTTMELCYHRFVHSEFMTHRVFSRNSASSRAIPVTKQIAKIEADIAYPVSWPAEQKGMSGGDELDPRHVAVEWGVAAENAVRSAWNLIGLGLHKSVVNRLLEPFMWHTVIVTSTEWDNFFGLRCSPKAMPEIRLVAERMREVLHDSTPTTLDYDEWHTPYIQDEEILATVEETRISAARCARVSYLTHDGKRDYEADLNLYNRLTSEDPPHASPLEHVATPTQPGYMTLGNFSGWTQLRHEVLSDPDLGAKTFNIRQTQHPRTIDVVAAENSEPDAVNHPPHYNDHPSGVECIDIVEHYPFNTGNAIKYIWRAGLKGGSLTDVEDLKKARWYLDREIANRGG